MKCLFLSKKAKRQWRRDSGPFHIDGIHTNCYHYAWKASQTSSLHMLWVWVAYNNVRYFINFVR